MKNSILYTFFVLAFLSCKAQSVTSKKEVIASTIKYINNGEVYINSKKVYNANNKLWGVKTIIPGIPEDLKIVPYFKFDEKEFKIEMANLFSLNRLEEFIAKKEKNLRMYIYVGEVGIPLEIYYSIDKNTTITAKELENMENYIKKNIRIPLVEKRYTGINHIQLTVNLNFKQLLDLRVNK